jgi:methyl-accepting chemotaxis protein
MDEIDKNISAQRQSLAEQLKAYEPLISGPEERKQFEEFQTALTAYFTTHTRLIDLSRGGEATAEQAKAWLRGESRTALKTAEDQLNDIIELNDRGAAAAAAAADATYASAQQWMMGLALAMTILAVGAAVTIMRSLSSQLGGEPGDVSDLAKAIAAGDLSTRVDVKPGDSSSVVAQMAAMQASLARVVATVRQNSESVATASAQIAQGNQDLSGRTEEQASALQQTAATMEQLGTTVRNNADSAKQANQLAQGASAVAAQGGEVVGKVVTTMQGINDSSRKIGDIISVIDGIAFQTNILALNAAVEAARAGEQGRGFAVVASEVRSLAQRSAEAAKEIKTLIGRSVEQVEQGTALVDQAGKTMGEIVGSIQRVSDIVAEITSASAEQSNGVQQVGDAVSQMDQATQQNAALVEESAAAAESLKAQAQQLVQAVAVFQLSQQTGSMSPALVAAPAAPSRAPERRHLQLAHNVNRPAPRPKSLASPVHASDVSPLASASAKAGTDDWASF